MNSTAAGGEGKYDDELKKGLAPAGLPLPSQTIKVIGLFT